MRQHDGPECEPGQREFRPEVVDRVDYVQGVPEAENGGLELLWTLGSNRNLETAEMRGAGMIGITKRHVRHRVRGS